ncbi:hypothetical protein [Nocardia sp. NPDC046763]|uniref:hypothetical protein n=1 Tax=Nocardia sp. NPDC046763 TaxID=3155256 RepID=UPI00340773CD
MLTVEPDASSPEPHYLPADMLETADAAAVTEDLIATAAHQWLVYVDVEENGQLVDTLTGELGAPDHVDWDTKANTESQPVEGMRHADSVEYRDPWTPLYFLPADQLAESGLRMRPLAEGDVETRDRC